MSVKICFDVSREIAEQIKETIEPLHISRSDFVRLAILRELRRLGDLQKLRLTRKKGLGELPMNSSQNQQKGGIARDE